MQVFMNLSEKELQAFRYKQYFYKQRQAEISKK